MAFERSSQLSDSARLPASIPFWLIEKSGSMIRLRSIQRVPGLEKNSFWSSEASSEFADSPALLEDLRKTLQAKDVSGAASLVGTVSG